jgi:hypothetical protein
MQQLLAKTINTGSAYAAVISQDYKHWKRVCSSY